jgi:RNA polymerase sigma factor (sigma-70 family)
VNADRDALVLGNRLMALWLLRSDPACRRLARQMRWEDAEGAALYALVRAAGAYDPSRGFTFSALLTRCVKNALLAELRHAGPVTIPPDVADGRRGAAPWRLRLARKARRSVGPPKGELTPAREPRRHEPDEREVAAGLLAVLPEREREAVRLRHWGGLTLAQLGQRLGGVSKERARQVLATAYRRMREAAGRAG